jgi:hypothetical protein
MVSVPRSCHKLLSGTKKTMSQKRTVSVSISLSFPRMVENGGTGASSTAKSLLENLHEGGGGKEAWEAKNKITEGDVASGKGMSWIEVFTRNCVGLGFKSMCRDQHGEPAARYDDSGRKPIGVEIVYHYATSPSDTDVRKSSRESVSMACPSSPDPSSYSFSDILPPSTIRAPP